MFIIAEIGINHNGDVNIAQALICTAKEAGCDAVKFQKRTLEVVYPSEVLDAPRESPWGTTNRQQKEALEFGRKEYEQIDAFCRELNIEWFASAWDKESQIFLRQFNLKYNKIASAMIVDEEARVFSESRAEDDLSQQLEADKGIYQKSYLQELLEWAHC